MIQASENTNKNILEKNIYITSQDTYGSELEFPIKPIRLIGVEQSTEILEEIEQKIIEKYNDDYFPIYYILDIEDKDYNNEKIVSKKITTKQAYKIAINTLKLFEKKWKSYINKDAKLSFIFDEEENI